jgi:hypothetical protein
MPLNENGLGVAAFNSNGRIDISSQRNPFTSKEIDMHTFFKKRLVKMEVNLGTNNLSAGFYNCIVTMNNNFGYKILFILFCHR